MSWFDSVTGSNEYERQSWRDSYNGGRAAGDITGNHNARISAERDAFQGTTYGGSSSQPSALELARSMAGPGNGAVRVGSGATGGGAGNEVVTQGPAPVAAPKGGTGPGSSRLVISGPLTQKMEPNVTQIKAGGNWWESNPWFSDATAWTDRYGEGELAETLFFAINATADTLFNASRARLWVDDQIDRAATRLHGGWNDSWVSPDTPVFSPQYNGGF